VYSEQRKKVHIFQQATSSKLVYWQRG